MEDGAVRSAVQHAAGFYGRRSAEPELVRTGANHVYIADDLVVRVSRSEVDVGQHVTVGRFLIDNGIPVPEPIGSGELNGAKYTVWEYIKPDSSAVVDFAQFGGGIRALHELDLADLATELPWCDGPDWLNIDQGLAEARSANVVSDEDIDLLESHSERLRTWGDRCRLADRHVLCHGDVHPQNVIMRDGRATLIDWDTICIGPPQWDHAALLTWADRWGGRPTDYLDFAQGYGEAFDGDNLAMELAEVRLLAPTVNMIVKGANNDQCAREARLRMRFWRNDPKAPHWTPQ